jgi:hypothetical protein
MQAARVILLLRQTGRSTASGSGSLAPLSASIATFWPQLSPTSGHGSPGRCWPKIAVMRRASRWRQPETLTRGRTDAQARYCSLPDTSTKQRAHMRLAAERGAKLHPSYLRSPAARISSRSPSTPTRRWRICVICFKARYISINTLLRPAFGLLSLILRN